MASRPRMMFSAFAQVVPSHHHQGLWRSPWGLAHPYHALDTWVDIAKTIERAKFDGLFLADHVGIMGKYKGAYREHVEGGLCFPNNDAIIIAAALSAVTSDLSLGFTSSLIQNQPFELARLTSTLDHITGGRVAWNVVTSALENSYRNVGFTELPTHEERYRRADDFLRVMYELCEGSWDDDAVIRDAENGIYADPSKVHKINHSGPYYSVEGPHLSEPSPQKTPFIYTAGMSNTALRLAAKHAEGLLIHAQNPAHARELRSRIDGFLVEEGRRPEDLKIIHLLKFVVGSTEEEAKRKYAELKEYIDPIGDIVESGGVLGVDLGAYEPDEEFDIDDAPGYQGVFGAANLEPGRKVTTIREMIARTQSVPIVGTPEQIADEIEIWQDAGVDGINVSDYMFHGSFHDFADHVTPVLQERGIAQKEYAPGPFRQKVFGVPHLNERHPGAKYRGAFSDNNLAGMAWSTSK